MKKLLFIISVITILSSCNSDDDTSQQSNFYALTVGNSWVYKYYTYDKNTSSYNETGVIDSISIVGTEEIYGDFYYKFKRTITNSNDENFVFEQFYFLREYEGSLINNMNKLFFIYSNYDEINLLESTDYSIIFKLQENEEEIITDAGTFNCFFAKENETNLDNNETMSAKNIYYKEGVGLIKINKTLYHNSEEYTSQISLVSYTVN